MAILKLTKSNIDKLPLEPGKPVDYFDSELHGFGLRVGKTSKSYFVRREIQGTAARIVIGKHGLWAPDQARDRAKELLRKMEQGIDPRQEKKLATAAGKTVLQSIEEYIEKRRIKDSTKDNYRRMKDVYLPPWHQRPLSSITRRDVLDLHRKITDDNGPAVANQAMATFRTVWNYSHAHLDPAPVCPTKALSVAQEWNPTNRRSDRLKASEFPAFLLALRHLKQAHHDAYLLTLHTGMRSGEVEALCWPWVDLEDGWFRVPDTKNNTELVLPLSAPMWEMMKRRKATARPGCDLVFTGLARNGGIVLQADHLHDLGFETTVHGLRRTFRWLCERLAIPKATTKRLMNHTLATDITDSYLDLEVEELRPWSEKISAEIGALGGTLQRSVV